MAKTTTFVYWHIELRYSKIKLHSIYTRKHTHTPTILYEKHSTKIAWIYWNWLAWIEFFLLNKQNKNYVCIYYIIQQTKLFIYSAQWKRDSHTEVEKNVKRKEEKRNTVTAKNGILNGYWLKKQESYNIYIYLCDGEWLFLSTYFYSLIHRVTKINYRQIWDIFALNNYHRRRCDSLHCRRCLRRHCQWMRMKEESTNEIEIEMKMMNWRWWSMHV